MKKITLITLFSMISFISAAQSFTIEDRGITYTVKGSMISHIEQGGSWVKTYVEFNKDSMIVHEIHEYSETVKSVYVYRLKTQNLSKEAYTESKVFLPACKTYPYFQLIVYTDYMRNDILYIIPPDSKYERTYLEFNFASEREMIGFRDKLFSLLK